MNIKTVYSSVFIKVEDIPVNAMSDILVEVYIHLPQVTKMSDGNRNP